MDDSGEGRARSLRVAIEKNFVSKKKVLSDEEAMRQTCARCNHKPAMEEEAFVDAEHAEEASTDAAHVDGACERRQHARQTEAARREGQAASSAAAAASADRESHFHSEGIGDEEGAAADEDAAAVEDALWDEAMMQGWDDRPQRRRTSVKKADKKQKEKAKKRRSA